MTGPTGALGVDGTAGPTGGSFTTLSVLLGSPTIESPTSVTLNVTGDQVGTTEFLNASNEGLYGQVVAGVPDSTNEINVGLDDGSGTTYQFVLTEGGYQIVISGTPIGSRVAYSGTRTFSMYSDSANIHFMVDGNVVETQPIVTTNPYQFVVSATNIDVTPEVLTDIRFYPTGKLGPTGATFTTLIAFDGTPTIDSPTSFTLTSVSDFVRTSESLNASAQGLYMQVVSGVPVGATSINVAIGASGGNAYWFNLTSSGYQVVALGVNLGSRVAYSGTPTFSIYTDSSSIYFMVDGAVVQTTSFISTDPYIFAANYVVFSSPHTFTNVRFYPTGKIGPTGAGFTTIANAADNRVLTSDGTTNSANAETNFTFDGSTLAVTGNVTYSGTLSNTTFNTANVIGGVLLSNGTVDVSRGTASAPSYSFLQDVSSGIFQPASNLIGFSTAGLQRMTIDGDGEVGIGTVDPITRLDVSGFTRINADTTTSLTAGNALSATGVGQFRIDTITDVSTALAGRKGRLVMGFDRTTNAQAWGTAFIQSIVPDTFANPLILQPAGGRLGIGFIGLPGGALDVSASTANPVFFRTPTYMRVPIQDISAAATTSATVSLATSGLYYNITNSAFNTITLVASVTTADAGAFWLFRNNTAGTLSVTILNRGTAASTIGSPIAIPSSNSITIAVSAFSNSCYVLL
jgi:hypothetical protein